MNIPSYDRKKVKKKIRLLRQEKNITCILACDSEEPELLSQFLYANQKDGTIKTFEFAEVVQFLSLLIKFLKNVIKFLKANDSL